MKIYSIDKIAQRLAWFDCVLTNENYECVSDMYHEWVRATETIFYICKCKREIYCWAKEIIYFYTPLCSDCYKEYLEAAFKNDVCVIDYIRTEEIKNCKVVFYCCDCQGVAVKPYITSHRRLSKGRINHETIQNTTAKIGRCYRRRNLL